jgi:type IV secretory pathway protease TraF
MSFNLSKLSKFCWLFLAAVLLTVMFVFPRVLLDRSIDTHSPSGGTVRLPQFPQVATPTTAVAWGETGATVLPLAAQIVAMRNPAGVALAAEQKRYLRPLFGDLVDRVRVVYRAQLLDRWVQSDGKEIHIGGVDSAAQTYCDRIYIRAAYRPRDTDRLVLLAHELTHSQQCDRAGSLSKFGDRYFQGYYLGGQSYQANPLEKSARAMEEKFTRQLCNTIGCPPRSGRFYVNYKGWGIKLPVNL